VRMTLPRLATYGPVHRTTCSSSQKEASNDMLTFFRVSACGHKASLCLPLQHLHFALCTLSQAAATLPCCHSCFVGDRRRVQCAPDSCAGPLGSGHLNTVGYLVLGSVQKIGTVRKCPPLVSENKQPCGNPFPKTSNRAE
jgi:hypothetical protein